MAYSLTWVIFSIVLGIGGHLYFSHSVKQLRSEKENELKAIAESFFTVLKHSMFTLKNSVLNKKLRVVSVIILKYFTIDNDYILRSVINHRSHLKNN